MPERRLKLTLWLAVCATVLIGYQNCSNDYKITTAGAVTESADGVQDYSSAVLVQPSRPNPPLDLFFVIDNSASMLGNQINLGNAFASVFQNNAASLANFDVNIYIFSTNSTFNASYESQIPTLLAANVTSIPSVSDATDLAAIPGSIFALQNTATGTYGSAPYSIQLNPAPVLDLSTDPSAITPSLHIAAQGTQTADQYAANVQAITQQFQHRLTYLNPTTELAYQTATDISSGLCTIARILKHSTNFINPGDSAAFVIVSDDNDRLNDRNPNNNQCLESTSSGSEVVDGTCGHYQTVFSYDTSDTITYQTDSKFNYQSGTQINYSYTSGNSCTFNYSNGYQYTSTYTLVQTQVTYTACATTADGTCVSETSGATATVAGNYVGMNGACTQDMTSLVPNPVAGTTYSCAAANQNNQTGPSGVDANSNGSQCSSQVRAQLNANGNWTNITCTVGALNMTTGTSSQPVGGCTDFCSANTQYPNCTVTASSNITKRGSFQLPTVGTTCSSQCSNSAVCGSGTISEYLTSTYGATAVCGTPSAVMSTLVVDEAANASGQTLTCSSSLSELTVTQAGTTVCSGVDTVQDCINSLQNGGTPISGCSVATGDKTTMSAGVNVTCSTTCTDSNGLCDPSMDTTVAAFLLRTKNALCLSAANGGAKTLSLQFISSLGSSASCSTPCSETTSGSCDGQGWGATNGATVANYIQDQLGGSTTCSASTSYVADTGTITTSSANPSAACTTATSPVFSASDSPHPATAAINYTAGDVNHLASDFQQFIVNQSSSIFGANNLPAVAVIGHMQGDDLDGTDVGTDYFNLAAAMNSTQITSVLGNYAVSLAEISQFIVQSAQNTFVLPVPSGDTVYSVSIVHANSGTSTPLMSSQWSYTSGTLSISASAGLQIGDQILFQYHN